MPPVVVITHDVNPVTNLKQALNDFEAIGIGIYNISYCYECVIIGKITTKEALL